MGFWEIAYGLTQTVFRFLYANGKTTIESGLSIISDGVEMVTMKISDWLYERGQYQWAHRIRVLNRYILNTVKVTAYVLSIWKTFETVTRLAIDGTKLDYIE